MADGPRADVVAKQYQNWQYPEPIHDLEAWLANNWQWFDPLHAQPIFWPNREVRADLDILVAGCGTNQAAVIAYNNPLARITAMDVSEPSLEHHRFLKNKYQLKNLELHCLPIEEIASLGQDFDLIISTGVLHHLADPTVGLRALAKHLRPDGVAAIMVYASYGRMGVEMLKGICRDLGLRQDQPSLAVLKAAIACLPADHPLQSYLKLAPDLEFDAGLIDTFLHGRDRNFTVSDCLDLVNSSGLVFQDWFLKAPYYPDKTRHDSFMAEVAKMPLQQQWSVMERIHHRNGCHFFTACHPERPEADYKIDFTGDRWLDAVPDFRYRCGLDGATIYKPGWNQELTALQSHVVDSIDGHRSIREILSHLANSSELGHLSQAELEITGKSVFESLWSQDFLALHFCRHKASAQHSSPAAQMPSHRLHHVSHSDNALQSALQRRFLSRCTASGEIRLPAVPALLSDYQALCDRTFAALGVEFSPEQRHQLRDVLSTQLTVAWNASPRSEIVISYKAPVGLTISYEVTPYWQPLGSAYDSWVTTREPPFFGGLPDARIWALANETENPSMLPVLDVGAGTGRNALALAHRGHPVDAVELSRQFAAILQAEAAKRSLPIRVIQRDVFEASTDLRHDYALVIASEVASDFRSPTELRMLLELAAAHLAPGGHLVFNVFLAQSGYHPDAAARELGQQVYSAIFTRDELNSAARELPLELVSDESVFDYERKNLPTGEWPPTDWYANWARGLDVFDLPPQASPIEMRWLVWRKGSVR